MGRSGVPLIGVILLVAFAAVGCSIPAGDPIASPQSASTPPSGEPSDGEDKTSVPSPPDPDNVAADFASALPTEWGVDVTGVVTRLPTDDIAITLDACGGPGGSGYDQQLIDGLITRQIPATLFLNSRWIEANPEITANLAANPLFELANHGTSHQPLSVTGESAYGISGTGSAAEAVREVWGNHVLLTELTGSEPRFFRSGTAHYDDVAVRIVGALGEAVVGFTVNADAGATYPAGTIQRVVGETEPGSILIAHMNQPDGETAEGLLAGVDDLLAQGHTFGFLGSLSD